MHEMGIAHEAYRVARAHLPPGEGHRLERVVLAVGELSAIEPDLLRFAWEAVVFDTPDAGAELDVQWRPALQTCAACGIIHQRALGSWLRLCPHCDGVLTVEGGDELDVLRIEYVPRGESGSTAPSEEERCPR